MGFLCSFTVSVQWLLSQRVSSYCSAKMEIRWKSGGISIWDNWNPRKKTERVIDVWFQQNWILSLRIWVLLASWLDVGRMGLGVLIHHPFKKKLLIGRPWQVTATRPDPDFFLLPEPHPDYFSKLMGLGISALGYFQWNKGKFRPL